MRPKPVLLLLSVSGLWCCDPCSPLPTPELDRVEAALSGGGGEISLPSDIRLDLSLDVRYVSALSADFSLIQSARACSPADPSGFGDEIAELSLVCDKPIRGFAPGQNILTTSADVFWIRQDTPSESPITLGQWLDLMNKGETASLGESYGALWAWRDAYDVSIAFIPEGTEAAAGEYNFTFVMEMQRGTRYEETFAPVTIAAL